MCPLPDAIRGAENERSSSSASKENYCFLGGGGGGFLNLGTFPLPSRLLSLIIFT
jgi:hypothetical protein